MAQQHWTGLVVDSLDRPIPFVIIHNKTQDRWTMTDEYGEFILPSFFNIDDSVYLSRIGLQTAKIQLPDFEYGMYILMFPNPIVLNSINVSAQSLQSKQKKEELFSVSKTPEMGNIEHKQLLAGIPGLSLRTYGGPAGISTLSLDGGPASQTKVIVSGFDLTNAQNGVMDISQLPTPFVEEVTYLPQEKSIYGPGNAEGIISLNPWSGNSGISMSVGSYGHKSLHGVMNIQKRNLIGNFLLGKREDDGDYSGMWKNQKFRRQNNHFNQEFVAMHLKAAFSNYTFFRFLFLQSAQERGVAGLIWSNNPKAYRDDELQVAGMKFGWIKKNSHGYIQSMIRRSWEHYKDELIGVNSRHKLFNLSTLLKQEIEISKKLKIVFHLEAKEDKISSSDTDNHSRTSFSTAITTLYRIFKFLELNPTYRYDFSPELYGEHTYEANLVLLINFLFLNSASINQGRYFRYPTFNDLYWKPGGNPDLKPEHTRSTSFQLNFDLNKQADLKVLVFQKSSNDLIQWTPVISYWQPVNIQHALRQGYKAIFRWSSSTIPIKGFVHYSRSQTENRSPLPEFHYGKPLRYAPKQTAAVSIDWQPGNWSFHVQMHYTDERISMYSWPEDVILPDVAVVTISGAYTWKISFGSLVLVGAIDNLTNESYDTIQGYPEPGRSFRLTISYQKQKRRLK